ncbi:beta galactosidase jelly roll domain-containing protein [Streptomyces sp. MUM 136J]|nr:beta galactosidase jelly roll domain-containing protein [Streptomyces sp. MUM 2J]MCH0571861.1 beta galactosidase jelly roll domain-containing protein [Streptomyces sp. MUM 136J]
MHTSVGLKITDDPSRHYRALIFVNGWQFGRYINDLGPQHSFPLPNGILSARRITRGPAASFASAHDAWVPQFVGADGPRARRRFRSRGCRVSGGAGEGALLSLPWVADLG